ncbi:MAG: hypothetical protein KFB97_15635 [Cyanobium sp. M30B3]|jgi:hypothetical protein|nr:MAG: hypothetical protein KFB97_15635 [Cyanobium sp. M30B3]
MPAPQTVIQAAMTRLSARLGSGLLDAAAQAAVVLQDAPERLRQEFSLFWQEVELEAERLERDGTAGGATAPGSGPGAVPARSAEDLQGQIDALRAQVAAFSRRLDQRP